MARGCFMTLVVTFYIIARRGRPSPNQTSTPAASHIRVIDLFIIIKNRFGTFLIYLEEPFARLC